MSRLPEPMRPELLRRGSRSSVTLVLTNGKTVGRMTPDRVVYKSFRPADHAYRKTPGVGLNLEMVCTFDQNRPAPKWLVLQANDQALQLEWAVVREFARDVLRHGERSRYWLHDDVDVQVLIPWEVFDGERWRPAEPKEST